MRARREYRWRWLPALALVWAFRCTAMAWGQAPARDLPAEILAGVKAPDRLPAGRYVPVQSWEAEGPSAGHNTGRRVADAAARNGAAWEIGMGRAKAGVVALFGPYLDAPAGDYVALFRIRLLDEAGEESVGTLDAGVDYGQNILRTRDLPGSELARDRYTEVPLAFHSPGGKLECRLFWSGYAGVRIDRISLFRLEEGQIDLQAERAAPAAPSGKPDRLAYRPEPRPYPDIFPRSASPAPELLTVDLHGLPPDRQLLLFSLQGLVNRVRPRIYALYNETDAFWLARMRRRGWVRRATPVRDPMTLLPRFRGSYRGVIVTDPALPATRNVATMLAGVRDGLVASPRLAAQLHLPVLADLRGRWKTSAAAYAWAFDALWPRLDHHVIACSYPDHLALRDYLVQHRVFIFWLSGPIDGAKPYADPTAEARLMERLFARMPANIPVMSYPWAGKDIGIGEGPGVTLFAEFAKYLVGSIDCDNLSVHSGIRVARLRPKPAPPAPKLARDKVYVSWVISDGDNLPVLTTSNFPQFWRDPARGHQPLGWSLSPSAPLLIPDIVDYYYTTATPNDEFLAAVSGVGYTYPDFYASRYRPADRRRLFDGFLQQTADYMDRAGLRSAWIMNATRPEVIARFAERIPGLEALFPDYGRRVGGYADATYPTARRVPVFHALTNFAEAVPRDKQIADVVAQIRSSAPHERPAFMHLFALNWFVDLPMLEEISRRLGPEFEVVRPGALAALYRQEMARQRLLVRVPGQIVGIEGQPITFTATLQNVTDRPMEVRVASSGGLTDAAVAPVHLRLAPGQSGVVRVAGRPAGDAIRLTATGPFGARTGTIALRGIPASEVVGALPDSASLRFVRHFTAVELAHRSGKAEADSDALAGTVWTARPGEAETGYVLYGPYAPMAKGRYLALFRVKRLGGDDGEVATLDASADGGKSVMAERTLRAGEAPVGGFVAAPLLFDHPGGALETRVRWPGLSGLSIDGVSLWEIITP